MDGNFNADTVISKLRQLKIEYINNQLGADPAQLPQHFSEFLGYATLLYDFAASAGRDYRVKQAKVIQEENAARDEINATAKTRNDKMTVTEMENRIDVRMSELKAKKDYLEMEVKGATLHINGCQSLMKNWGDEAKGIR